MTKPELIDNVYQAMLGTVLKRDVEDVIQLTFTHMRNAVAKDHRFEMAGFGTFTMRIRKARTGYNPQTGMPIKIPLTKTVGFKPAPAFKKFLAEKWSS